MCRRVRARYKESCNKTRGIMIVHIAISLKGNERSTRFAVSQKTSTHTIFGSDMKIGSTSRLIFTHPGCQNSLEIPRFVRFSSRTFSGYPVLLWSELSRKSYGRLKSWSSRSRIWQSKKTFLYKLFRSRAVIPVHKSIFLHVLKVRKYFLFITIVKEKHEGKFWK